MCCVDSGEMTQERWQVMNIEYTTLRFSDSDWHHITICNPCRRWSKAWASNFRSKIFNIAINRADSYSNTFTSFIAKGPSLPPWVPVSFSVPWRARAELTMIRYDPLRSFRLRIKTILSEWTVMKYPWISFWFLSSACGCHAACSFRAYCKLHVYSG